MDRVISDEQAMPGDCTRRSFLTTLVASGASTAIQPAAADQQGDTVDPMEACTVDRCPPAACRGTVGAALADTRFTALVHRFRENGWRLARHRAYVIRTIVHATEVDHLDEEATYCSLVVPFTTGRERETAVLLWREHPVGDAADVGGFHSIHGSTAADVPDDAWQITTYTVTESGTVATDIHRVDNFLGCNNVNWTCVLDIAAAYAGLFGSCAVCAGSLTPPACALCLSTVLNWMRAVRCDWCND